MTNISFYILKSDTEHDRQVFACRLASKAYHQGKHIYIHTQNEAQTEQMNQLLWSFRSDSFIPHQIVADDNDCPILLSHNAKPPRLMDLLINLNTEQPQFFSQFDRVAECIDANDDSKAAGRKRYQFYQQRGYQLTSHHV